MSPRGGEDGTDRVGALSPSWQVGRFAYAICYIGLICICICIQRGGSSGSCIVWTSWMALCLCKLSKLSPCVCFVVSLDIRARWVFLVFMKKEEKRICYFRVELRSLDSVLLSTHTHMHTVQSPRGDRQYTREFTRTRGSNGTVNTTEWGA